MKRLLGIGLVAAMVATSGANSAQALSIGINFANGGNASDGMIIGSGAGYSTYSEPTEAQPVIVTTVVNPQSYWNNIDAGDPGSFAGVTSLNVVDNTGHGLYTLSLDASVNDVGAGGSDLNGIFFGNGTAGYAYIASKDKFNIGNIPYQGFTVAVMMGYYNWDASWYLISGSGPQSIGNRANSGYAVKGYELYNSRFVDGSPGAFDATGEINAGAHTFTLSSSDATIYAIQIMNEVPEPSTMVLLGSLLGLGAIGGLRKRFFGAKKSVVA